jgi:hypothetical protein
MFAPFPVDKVWRCSRIGAARARAWAAGLYAHCRERVNDAPGAGERRPGCALGYHCTIGRRPAATRAVSTRSFAGDAGLIRSA